MRRFISLLFFIFLTACSTPQTVSVDVERERVDVYVDAFSEAWLPALYMCAERSPVWLVARTPSVDAANLILRVNSNPEPDAAAYAVGEIEFVLAVNDANPVEMLSADEIRAIYSGQVTNWAQLGGDDAPIQLWAYAPETGLNGVLLGRGTLSSLAYQAQSPRAMRDALASDSAAVGILPVEMEFAEAGIRRIPSAEMKFPVLLMLPDEQDGLKSLAACLQEK